VRPNTDLKLSLLILYEFILSSLMSRAVSRFSFFDSLSSLSCWLVASFLSLSRALHRWLMIGPSVCLALAASSRETRMGYVLRNPAPTIVNSSGLPHHFDRSADREKNQKSQKGSSS
jgi:hypothetical protein